MRASTWFQIPLKRGSLRKPTKNTGGLMLGVPLATYFFRKKVNGTKRMSPE
jgi:hypothetical protein